MEFAVAWAIEIPEINALPRAEEHPPFRHDDCFADTGQGCLDVGIGVAFDVPVASLDRKSVRISPIHVLLHVRVGVFVDCDGGGRMRTKYDYDTVLHAAFRQSILEIDIDIRQRLLSARLDAVSEQIFAHFLFLPPAL